MSWENALLMKLSNDVEPKRVKITHFFLQCLLNWREEQRYCHKLVELEGVTGEHVIMTGVECLPECSSFESADSKLNFTCSGGFQLHTLY